LRLRALEFSGRVMPGVLCSTAHLSAYGGADTRQVDVHRPAQPVRCLAPGEILFQTGDPHGELYRVVRGSLCHYTRWHRGCHEIIEFVFPGAIVGFGHIATLSTARATLHTEIGIVTPDEFACALRSDGQLAARVAAAADREFDYLRFRAKGAVGNRPTQRLASLLAALSRINAREGREAALIPDEIPSGAIAERLDMSIDGLAAALWQLEARGLVAPSTAGLRIIDIVGLERLADANSLPHSSHPKLEAPDA
jgi:CRP/FNR family transcriptional regulator, anaerobic regulatory protein